MGNPFKALYLALGAVVQYFIFSPRFVFNGGKGRPNPDLYKDDKTGKVILKHPDFTMYENYQVLFPAVSGRLLNAHYFKHPTSKKILLLNMGRAG